MTRPAPLPEQISPRGWSFFDTALGPCALAWGVRGIVAVQLPEATPAATRARLLRASGPLPEAAAPPAVAAAMAAIAACLAGQAQDMGRVVLDMGSTTPFQQRVYALARGIAPGQTRTYVELAEQLGGRHLARAVGQALGRNPFAPVVPCHRVLAAGGKAGGFSAHGGAQTKLRMLAAEGAPGPGGTAPLWAAPPGPPMPNGTESRHAG